MRRRHRIFLAALTLAASLALIILLLRLGRASEGPVGVTLEGIGSGVRRMESGIVRRVRGGGRSTQLAWLAAARDSARLLRATDTLLLGAYDDDLPRSLEGVLALEQKLGTTLPLIQVYAAWGDRPAQRFPQRMVEVIDELGSIPVITWEPWLTDFENRLHPHLSLRAERDRGGLGAIARGDYDFYIDRWARDAAAHGGTVFVRFAHEMNDPYRYPWGPQNNPPQDFIAAWRHVVERFRAAGADNVLWVWAPHLAYAGWETYYPGHDVVDWVATGALNYGTVASWSQWWSFEQIFGKHYAAFAGLGKPIMIAEFGSLAVGGDRAGWYGEALGGLRRRYPAVSALLFFHVDADATVTYQELDWSFDQDSAVLSAVRAALHR